MKPTDAIRILGLSAYLLVLFFSASSATAAGNPISKIEFSKLVVKAFGLGPGGSVSFLEDIKPEDPDFNTIQSMWMAFPGIRWDGKQWHSEKNAPLSQEQAIDSLMRVTNLVLSDMDCGVHVQYRKSLPYVCSAIRYGLLRPDETHDLDQGLSLAEASKLVRRFHDKKVPESLEIETHLKEVRVQRNFSKPDLHQPYFPDGPIQSALSGTIDVPATSQFHQYEGVLGSVVLHSSAVNGIGVWGAANSDVDHGRIWGGFMSGSSIDSHNQDSQVIGTEVDVINNAKDGKFPNESKVGVQIVSIGTRDSSTALEVISDTVSKWYNALTVQENAIAPEGSVLTVAQTSPMKTGIDFSRAHFTDGAIHLRNTERVRFDARDEGQAPAAIYASKDRESKLVLQAGKGGLVVLDNSGSHTLLEIDQDGQLNVQTGATRGTRIFLALVTVLNATILATNFYLKRVVN